MNLSLSLPSLFRLCRQGPGQAADRSAARLAMIQIAVLSGPILKNPISQPLRRFDQRFRSRLGYAQNPGSIVRRSKSAVDPNRMSHTQTL